MDAKYHLEEDEETIDHYAYDDLSEDDFAAIKKLAIRMYDRGDFDKNQFKCAVVAFNQWVKANAGINEDRILH